ncbi:alkaline phosphatase-like protein [Lactarius pseudohatsudake]|nr:alkaline phosphatase-like protein [Lactarius pseudohatsudake]
MTTSWGSTARLLALGIVFHLVYIGTVFDCYFTSPVVHGMRQHRLSQAQAKRLVLIVGDGLRADFVLSANASQIVPGAPERVAPYLRDIVESRGAYGISHTRVPTESRPGHVAIIGGMYEDVSAGWKTNPVDFDSVFNQSSHTFSFGSPDILPMFVQGATPGRVEGWSYHEDQEDFTKDATALDIWVIDQLKSLFRNATTNETLDAQLRAPQVVFFLHLLGLDVTGHSYRPHSKEYINNIRVVDDIVRETEQLISGFYGDQETSYIFTADHGMSKIGNHGDGDPDNTRTPLIAWGAGIRKPIRDLARVADDYSTPWELSHIVRRDVEQADIASLMSALLGTFWPVNGVGILPDVDPTEDGYLSMRGGEREVAEASVVNAKVVLEHYRVKHELKKAHAIWYKPYEFLDHPSSVSEYPGSQRLSSIESLIASGRFQEARHHSHELIKATLGGIRYLETYDRTLIRTIVTLAYTGWIAFTAAYILAHLGYPLFFNLATVAFCGFFAIQRLPWTLHIYILFPSYFWQNVARRISGVPSVIRNHKLDTRRIANTAFGFILAVAALQSMVVPSASSLLGSGWPLISWPEGRRRLFGPWAASCLLTAVFPLLRVDPSESLDACTALLMPELQIGSAGRVCYLLGSWPCAMFRKWNPPSLCIEPRFNFGVTARIQLLLTALSMLVTAASVQSLQAKHGLPRINQVAGWTIFLLSALLPFFMGVPRTAEGRLLTYFLSFCPCFVLLSIRAEGLFYLSYCATLYLWTRVEEVVRSETLKTRAQTNGRERELRWNPQRLSLDDVGFFGTGNQFRSFYLEPVYRLIPVFSPFLMAALLLFKILAPFVFLSAAFATLNARLGMPPFALFLVALSLTDGSWLQIGQSISHFCITSLLLVFSAGVTSFGETLMRGAATPGGRHHIHAQWAFSFELIVYKQWHHKTQYGIIVSGTLS